MILNLSDLFIVIYAADDVSDINVFFKEKRPEFLPILFVYLIN